MNIRLKVPDNFKFWSTVYSHGWCSLQPFEVLKEENKFRCALRISNRNSLVAEIAERSASSLDIELPEVKKLGARAEKQIVSQVKACFRLTEDYSAFYNEAGDHKQFRWIEKIGAGRLLRSPTVFEDVVKMICTTNCSWALTEVMVRNLCEKLGDKVSATKFAFPQPDAIADQSEKFIRKEIRSGYRAPYLLELAKRVARKNIDIELWRESTLPTDELFDEVRSVKGVGPYAAGNILKLLGRYDFLAIDSWCRKRFFELHKNGRSTSDRVIERFYAPYGKWQGLIFWLDLTKYWYDQRFPF